MLKPLLGLLQRRLLGAFKYSIDGLLAAWKSEEAIKVEIATGTLRQQWLDKVLLPHGL